MNKKVLITGTTGFIFSNFIRKAIYDKQPYQFVSIDRVNGNANLMYWNKNHIFHVADIRDQHIIDTIFQFEKPDIVIHGAAESFVDASLVNANEFMTSNVLGTQVIINSCIKHNVEKLIYISTDEVYGHLTNEDAAAWSEDAILNPRNPYSASKAAGELLVRAANQSHGLTYNITRSSNNYGPRQTSEKLIPKIIKCITEDKKIPVYGQGLQIRDWTYVSDNCDGILTVLNKGLPNETYNIASNQEITNIEVVQKICNVMGKGHQLIEFVKDRPGHDFRYSINASKLKTLGWDPKVKFKDGIEQCILWYMANQWFLK